MDQHGKQKAYLQDIHIIIVKNTPVKNAEPEGNEELLKKPTMQTTLQGSPDYSKQVHIHPWKGLANSCEMWIDTFRVHRDPKSKLLRGAKLCWPATPQFVRLVENPTPLT